MVEPCCNIKPGVYAKQYPEPLMTLFILITSYFIVKFYKFTKEKIVLFPFLVLFLKRILRKKGAHKKLPRF
jgi:hypothetical protein